MPQPGMQHIHAPDARDGGGDHTISVGKSILDRSSKTNIGSLLLEFGGGHKVAGGCKVKNEDAEAVVGQLIERITADG